jgi:hypothetical protein
MNNKFWNAPAWSMGNRYAGNISHHLGKSNTKHHTGHMPGPGTYDLAGTGNKNGCRYTISNNKEWAHLLVASIIEKINQGLASIFNLIYSYNISSKIDGPKISMANRFAQGGFAASSFTPGPGNYNTNQ